MKDMLQQAEYEWQKHKYDYPVPSTRKIPISPIYHSRNSYRPYLTGHSSSERSFDRHRSVPELPHASSTTSSSSYPPTPTPHTPHEVYWSGSGSNSVPPTLKNSNRFTFNFKTDSHRSSPGHSSEGKPDYINEEKRPV